MKIYNYKVLHVPSGAVINKKDEFESELEFHRQLQSYNKKSALQSKREHDSLLWIYYSDELIDILG